MGIAVDDRQWPIVRVAYCGPLTRADHDALVATVGDCLDRGQRFGLVFATRPAGRAAPGIARAQFAWLDAERDRLARWLAGWAMVEPAAEAIGRPRGGAALDARMPFPRRTFGRVSDAVAWVAECLAAGR